MLKMKSKKLKIILFPIFMNLTKPFTVVWSFQNQLSQEIVIKIVKVKSVFYQTGVIGQNALKIHA